MADKKITALTESTSLSTDDLFHVVDSPGSSPSNKKITVNNVFNKIPSVLGLAATDTLTDGTGQTASLTTAFTLCNSGSGAIAVTLPNATLTGQLKTFVCVGAAAATTITVTTTIGSMSTIILDAVGETATLLWTGSGWTSIATSSSAGNIATVIQ